MDVSLDLPEIYERLECAETRLDQLAERTSGKPDPDRRAADTEALQMRLDIAETRLDQLATLITRCCVRTGVLEDPGFEAGVNARLAELESEARERAEEIGVLQAQAAAHRADRERRSCRKP